MYGGVKPNGKCKLKGGKLVGTTKVYEICGNKVSVVWPDGSETWHDGDDLEPA